MRFTAPRHASSVHLSNGVHSVRNGVLTVPDDTPASDLGGLYANGYRPLAPEPKPEAKPKATGSK